MADTSKITLGQLKTALTQAKNYTDNEIAGVAGVSKVEPEELDMPKVFFYGTALPTTKDNVNLTMDYVSNTDKFSSFVKLKCQGTSSISYAKKNFTVAMYSDEARTTKLKKDFKGWGAQSKFCLKANYVDTTHTRNLSGARIAYDMVASRPDSTFKQQLLQCPRNGLVDGFPIKLYFNGEFYGIYTWNIPKDTWMFNMDKSNQNHIVLCAEKNTDGNSSAINSCQFRQLWTNGDGQDWSVEVGTMSEDLRTKFNRVIAFVMNTTDQEFHDNIGEYFDLYSLLDYYCFSYFVNHLDGLAKNMLMVTYDGVHWGASLYDMDSIYGVSWNGGSFVSPQYQCPEQYQEQFSALWQRIERCFGTELYARYLELRQGALSLSNIIKHVEEIYDVIPDRVFADEKAKWTSLPNVSTNTMTRFRNYMRDRAVYVDAQMQEIGTKAPCTGIVLSADTLSFTTTDTQTLSVVVSPDNCTDAVTWSVSPTGIVTVVNGVVTPISNGTCTITATCGTYSDTCAVTVSLPSVACTGITLDQDTLTIDASTSTTAQLTATVTPENCTQPVLWSVSPEGIVTVNNGLVTAVANGEATVTATCGTQSANCAVTVSGMSVSGGDTDIYATAEYAITEPRTFNGTSDYIDTGLKLFDTAKTFTIFIDYTTATPTSSNSATIFHCLHEAPSYRGLCLMEMRDTNDMYFIGGQSTGVNYVGNLPASGKCLIEFIDGVMNKVITINNSYENIPKDPYAQISENLLIGCYQDSSGTKGRFWTGTINKFGVWYKQLTEAEINQVFGKSGGDTPSTNPNLVFQVNSASMNTANNTLTDNIAGISATLTGNPTVSGNQIAFDVDDTFSFDISSLNLTNSNRTFRIKFTPTNLDDNTRNVMGVGNATNWDTMTTFYITSSKLILQHGSNGFANNTVGGANGGHNFNRLSTNPVIGQEYEIVISENISGNVRWYVDGTLVQDGTTTFYNPLCLSNTEGNKRFIGNYSLIEIYNEYCNDYTEFTNMINN